MKRLPLLAAAVLSLLLSDHAIAQVRSGFSFDVGLGASVIRDDDGNETFRDSAFGWTIGGDYRFNNHFSFGIGIFSLGEGEDDFGGQQTTISVRGFDIRGRGFIPLSENVDLFGLLGVVNYHVDIDPGFSFDPFGSEAWEAGLGLDVHSGNNLAIRFEGRFFNGERDESAGLLTIGFNYTF